MVKAIAIFLADLYLVLQMQINTLPLFAAAKSIRQSFFHTSLMHIAITFATILVSPNRNDPMERERQ
jgi:hypothetical protein